MNQRLAKSPLEGVSVIICCYNSATRLPETLRHLARQDVPESIAWEVIVIVDDASTDDSDGVARREWDCSGCRTPLRVMRERKRGKSAAMQTAFYSASYDVIVIVDDDNWLHPGYLARGFELMRQHPRVGVIGGRLTPAFEEPPPPWFSTFSHCFAVGPQGRSSGDITAYKRHVAGAGMVLRKAAFLELRARNFEFVLSGGRNGNLLPGEDLELCYALVLLGYRVWYDEKLILTHFMPRGRVTKKQLLKLFHLNRMAGPMQASYEVALSGQNCGVRSFYVRRVLLLGSWLCKSTVKFLIGRESLLALELSFLSWFQSLLDYPKLRSVFSSHYPNIVKLRASALELR
jgi:glycosyltransferase involved in cell wall biosynthesis